MTGTLRGKVGPARPEGEGHGDQASCGSQPSPGKWMQVSPAAFWVSLCHHKTPESPGPHHTHPQGHRRPRDGRCSWNHRARPEQGRAKHSGAAATSGGLFAITQVFSGKMQSVVETPQRLHCLTVMAARRAAWSPGWAPSVRALGKEECRLGHPHITRNFTFPLKN